MSQDILDLHVLLVEDDRENLALLAESLPSQLDGCALHYEPSDDIEGVPTRLKWQRFDLVLTDIYKDRPGRQNKTDEADAKAGDIVRAIRKHRFCPVIAFTDGSHPLSLTSQQGPFLVIVDKSSGNDQIVTAMRAMLATGIPQTARRMHDELDEAVGPKFLWGFVESHWDALQTLRENSPALLERLIRRRAAIQWGCLDPASVQPQELKTTTAAAFYIMPPVASGYRLGSIVRRNADKTLYVILTPHCHLEVQPDQQEPRADNVLLVLANSFQPTLRKVYTKLRADQSEYKSPWEGSADRLPDKIRQHINSPPSLGSPKGRYWFLPGFLDIPDSYCDLMQVMSVPFKELHDSYSHIAMLDTPFAESLQAHFTFFYGVVGVPNLDPAHFMHLTTSDRNRDVKRT